MNTHDNHHLVHWFSMTISGSLVQGRKKNQYLGISCGRGTDARPSRSNYPLPRTITTSNKQHNFVRQAKVVAICINRSSRTRSNPIHWHLRTVINHDHEIELNLNKSHTIPKTKSDEKKSKITPISLAFIRLITISPLLHHCRAAASMTSLPPFPPTLPLLLFDTALC